MSAEPIEVDPARVIDRLRVAASNVATEAEARAVAEQISEFVRRVRAARWEPYPWQHPHIHPDGWVSDRVPGKAVCDARCILLPTATIPAQGMWLNRSGRGCGKTDGAAHLVNLHAESPACDTRSTIPGGHRFTIVAPTQADAVSACVEGPSGLKSVNPGIVVTTNREGTTARWPNGTTAKLVGANSEKDIDRLRAWSNICLAWVEEAAAMPRLREVLHQVPFTLRLGNRLETIVTTTPANRPEVVALIDGHPDHPTIQPAAIQTWGRTRDADRLPEAMRTVLEERYGGTTLGLQELDGELIGDVEGALWVQHRPDLVDALPNTDHRPGIDNDRALPDAIGWTSHRIDAPPPPVGAAMVTRVVVAVDPPGGRTECGIVVVGTIGQHAYPLADLSIAGPPDTWGRQVLQAYLDFGAEGIAAEHTYGGDMVADVINSRISMLELQRRLPAGERDESYIDWPDHLGTPPIFKVPTKVGKRLRAEPVQGLYQQHRVHHVGLLPGLETEQRTWVPDESPDSPNRVDALVHGITYLLIRAGTGQVSNPARRATSMPTTFGDRRR